MKNISKLIATGIVAALLVVSACKEPFDATPVPATSASSYSANFLFANTSDATSLDFYVNNLITGASVPADSTQAAYTKASIASNGGFANTAIQGRATSGAIGGTLKSSNLIFRSANNGTGNYTALDSGYYTVIVLDSITRPAPVRKLNAGNFGDVTFFNPLDGTQLSVVDTIGLSAAVKAQLITVGVVPLGSSDPGGPRFVIITDQLPLPSTTRFPKPAAGKISVRFANASADAGGVTATVGGLTTGSATYPFALANWSPSVGSKTTTATTSTAAYTVSFSTATSGVSDVVIKFSGTEITRLSGYTFDDKGVYTVILDGSKKKGTLHVNVVKNK